MKTAEEWIEYHRVETPYRAITVADIQQIQLDAIKEGMTRAVESIKEHLHKTDFCACNQCETRRYLATAILNIRDNLKEI